MKRNQKDNLKTYLVTGILHGSIVLAKNSRKARKIFRKYYDNEKILKVKETRIPPASY